MIFNVCIIENEPAYTKQLLHDLNKWKMITDSELKIASYLSGEKFLESNTSEGYHIFFLDIKLDKLSGLDLAKILRKQHYSGEIVFLTSFYEYVLEGYHVHALNYLLKPVSPEEIYSCMNYIFNKFTGKQYKYSYKGMKINIPYHDIIYFNSRLHNIEITTVTRQYTEVKKFALLKQELPTQFLQCHRGLIINTDHILQLSRQEVTLTNQIKLPVSATYTEHIQQAFLKQAEMKTYL